jgi:hypothetical protein
LTVPSRVRNSTARSSTLRRGISTASGLTYVAADR